MRKRTQDNLFDNIMWYLVYLLPLILLIVTFSCTYAQTGTMPTVMDVMNNVFYYGGDDLPSWCYSFLESASYFIGNDAFAIIGYFCFWVIYFVQVYLCHLLIDFILFIPRLCHKWLKAFTQGE